MDNIQLNLNEQGKGSFFLEENGERLAEMVIRVDAGNLTVFHTEVSERLKGKGVATKLLSAMVDYARANHLKVIPLCVFVKGQFEKHESRYADIWNKDWHDKK